METLWRRCASSGPAIWPQSRAPSGSPVTSIFRSPALWAGQEVLEGRLTSLQGVQDGGGDLGELVKLLGGEAVDEQAPYLLGVAGRGLLEHGEALRRDHRVHAAGAAPFPGDEASGAHPGELVVQAALFPAGHPAELVRAQPPAVRLGQHRKHAVVGAGQAAALELLLDAGPQQRLHLEERPPGAELTFIQSLLLHGIILREG